MLRRSIAPLLALALVAPGWAVAADAPVPSAPDTGTEIHLVQRAEKEMPRDRIDASLRVEAEGADPAKVQAEVNARMTKALAAAKGETSVKAETTGYSVYQEPPPDKGAPTKWHASQSMTLTSKDFAAALSLVGALQGQGLLLEGLSFDLAPDMLRATEDELTAEALASLRARAERIAADLKMDVVRYKSIEIGNATAAGFPPPMVMMRAMAKGPGETPPPAAEAGESTISLTVQAQVIMAPAKAP